MLISFPPKPQII